MYYENFEYLCRINNVNPSKVSKATGISTATLTSWKQGKYTPKQDKLQLIADFFGVSIDFLINGKETGTKEDALLTNMDIKIKEYSLKLAELPKEKQELVMQMIDNLL